MAESLSPERLSVVFYQEDGDCYAHCLEFDLVESGKSFEEAKDNIKSVIKAHIEWALGHDNMQNLLRSAPIEYWKRFFAGKFLGSEQIHISVPDSAAPIPSAWQLREVKANHLPAA